MKRLRNIKTRRKAVAMKFTGENQKEVEEFLDTKFDRTEEGSLFHLGRIIPKGHFVIKEMANNQMTYKCEYLIMSYKNMKKLFIKDRDND